MKIYLASSWRNEKQPGVLCMLRAAGHLVYDFTDKTPHPKDGQTPETFAFKWSAVDKDWTDWTPETYVKGLKHWFADRGYSSDFNAMQWADACVLTLPCNRSAHLELGWMLGQGKPGFILLDKDTFEPELMYKLATSIHTDIFSLLTELGRTEQRLAVRA